jgi:hypothetical protein
MILDYTRFYGTIFTGSLKHTLQVMFPIHASFLCKSCMVLCVAQLQGVHIVSGGKQQRVVHKPGLWFCGRYQERHIELQYRACSSAPRKG